MYILLILFFISLLGIIFMVGRKLFLLEKGYIFEEEAGIPVGQYFEKWKRSAQKNLKMLVFVTVVILVRLYVKISNFVEEKYQQIAFKLKSTYIKKSKAGTTETKETSKFLKMVGEYKRKLRKIK